MVFYTEILPTEIWFEIYKTEHAQQLKYVNGEIQQLCLETNIQNSKLLKNWFKGNNWYFGDIQPDGRPSYLEQISAKLWNINKYLTFKNKIKLNVFFV